MLHSLLRSGSANNQILSSVIQIALVTQAKTTTTTI